MYYRHFIAISISRASIKQVPGCKEIDPDDQFTDNYPDNQVSVPVLLISVVIV